LLTTAALALQWHLRPGFERILVAETPEKEIDLPAALQQLAVSGLQSLAPITQKLGRRRIDSLVSKS
jgi:hypothetical protein